MKIGRLKSVPPKMTVELDIKDIIGLIELAAMLNNEAEVCRQAQTISSFMQIESRHGEPEIQFTYRRRKSFRCRSGNLTTFVVVE
jgi:hypothetical protein